MNMGSVSAAAGTVKTLANVLFFGGVSIYGVTHSIFNVEGGHRAIVFNRVTGIKEEVRTGGLFSIH